MRIPFWIGLLFGSWACQPPHNSDLKEQDCAFTNCGPGPLDPKAPWPKFRGNLQQNGRSAVRPTYKDSLPWSFASGKGVFSSPIIATDGTILFGSADRNFYALSSEGKLRWTVSTGEIIDSSGLIDRDGRVYFGSGDGRLRARDVATGDPIWEFLADDPTDTNSYIRWFEGNVAVGRDGTLYAPNDNFRFYALDRDGQKQWVFPLNDQSWSSPAVDPESGHLYFGSNYIAPFSVVGAFYKNIFALNPEGQIQWRQSVQASVTASPLLSLNKLVIVGSFDGSVRAYRQNSGRESWSFQTSDHIYASPAEQSTGTIIQASTDGRIYALDGRTGQLQWSFDAKEPIRSSPAIDGYDRIYFGGGDGALYVLEANGQLRYRMQLIFDDRNDLNASPALGPDAVYIAGEDGVLWSVPYDYCLHNQGQLDRRCTRSPAPAEVIDIKSVSAFGSYQEMSDLVVSPGQFLAFRLTQNLADNEAILDPTSIRISGLSPQEAELQVAEDQKTLYLLPKTPWGPKGAMRTVTLDLAYKKGFTRQGLKRTGGIVAGTLQKSFKLHVTSQPVDNSRSFAITRLAVPMPTIMPSYNQIGFDSLSYILRLISSDEERGIAYMLPAIVDEAGIQEQEGKAFVLNFEKVEGSIHFRNNGGFEAQALNFTIPFEDFRIEMDASGVAPMFARTSCGRIPTYGYFLRALGFCSPLEDKLSVFGAARSSPLSIDFDDREIILASKLQKRWFGAEQLELDLDATQVDADRPLVLVFEDLQSRKLIRTDTIRPKKGEQLARILVHLKSNELPSSTLLHVLQGPHKLGTQVLERH